MAGETGRLIAATLAAAVVLAAGPPAPVHALAGRYSSHFVNGNVDGDTYESDDVVEVVPVDPRHAYFRISLHFFNGHSCGLYGIAEAQGDALVYRAGAADAVAGCTMRVSRRGRWLNLDDSGGSCQASCGARGGYAGNGLPWASRRPIRYLARLKASAQYRAALAEWAKGKSSRP